MVDPPASPSDGFANRLRPARPDLAAEHLRGMVPAETYVRGQAMQVNAPLLDLTVTPSPSAERATQLLLGEVFVVYETRPDGLVWGQAELDGYVGYVAAAGLGPPRGPGQRVTALWSQIYARPNARAHVLMEVPFFALLHVSGSSGGYFKLRDGGFVPRPHLAPLAGDFVTQAERFRGVPYLWGGRSARGLDCSALVQLALIASGTAAPRDSDMQAALVGAPLGSGAELRRGDLIFWRGHVAIVQNPGVLIHASGYHMAVVSEPLGEAVARIAAAGGGPVIARRRP